MRIIILIYMQNCCIIFSKEGLMYNSKSKTSAILAIITAVLLVGLMVLVPFLLYNTELEGLEALALIFAFIYGFLPLYVGAFIWTIVGLVFGIKMLKQQSRKKLISFNRRMLATTIVLLPLIAFGMTLCSSLILRSSLGLFPTIYTVITALAYIACLITQIATIVALKKLPEETDQ